MPAVCFWQSDYLLSARAIVLNGRLGLPKNCRLLTNWSKSWTITAFIMAFKEKGRPQNLSRDSYRPRLTSKVWSCRCLGAGFSLFLIWAGATSFTTALAADQAAQPQPPSAEALSILKKRVQDEPQDAKANFAYGRALRLSGRNEEAATYYLQATALEPSFYVAYHELSLSKARPGQLDEAIDRLQLLMGQQPHELMLRVALSELLEDRGSLYPAAKVLVDLVYENCVPEKYLPRVKARISYLLSKNKDAQVKDKARADDLESESAQSKDKARVGESAESTSAPLPLPDSSLRRNLAATKLKDAKDMSNFGHTTLLP